jgi:hypothetical protein
MKCHIYSQEMPSCLLVLSVLLLETSVTRMIDVAMVMTTSESKPVSCSFLVMLMRTFQRMEIGSDTTVQVRYARAEQLQSKTTNYSLRTSVNTSSAQLTLSVVSWNLIAAGPAHFTSVSCTGTAKQPY